MLHVDKMIFLIHCVSDINYFLPYLLYVVCLIELFHITIKFKIQFISRH